jgi:pimeloyl-ACP methyl ester carboxylesterase
MPAIKRPDGVELHFDERGEGPPVVLCLGVMSYPPAWEELIAELARDHRVVVYDARGIGQSTRTGPYDRNTDAADLAAVAEHLGGGTVVITNANATNVAVQVAAERPELVEAVVAAGGSPLGREALAGSEGLAASESVVAAMLEQLRNDYRGAMRTLVAGLNNQFDEDQVRERVGIQVEYTPQEAGLGRIEAWIEADAAEQGRALGDRLWLLNEGENLWFPGDMLDVMRELLPEAHIEEVAGGPLSRPDIVVDAVRQLTAVRR